MILYVVSWFVPDPGSSTGWSKGIAAFTDEQAAMADHARRRTAAELEASRGRPARASIRRACSTIDLVVYTLAGPPSLELMAAALNAPPPGAMETATWWSSARVALAWWGGQGEAHDREATTNPPDHGG